MNKKLTLELLSFIFLIICGCCSSPEFVCHQLNITNQFYDRSLPKNKAIIKGIITNQAGMPADSRFGAKITTLLGDSTSVDSNGSFSLMVNYGRQVITFSNGRSGVVQTLYFANQGVTTVTVCIEETVSHHIPIQYDYFTDRKYLSLKHLQCGFSDESFIDS